MYKDKNPRYKVLIVDDEPGNIKIMVDLLRHDYDTFFAKSGKKALELASDIQPDIILLDIVMPEMDGYEVCASLKKNKALSNIPVIFISAKSHAENEIRGFALGAVDYIIKPVSPPILNARIKTHLKLSSAMKELNRLYSMAMDASPLTGLPGNNSILRRIESALTLNENICVIYTDLDNFKAYNDKYGFAKGDEVILFNSSVLQNGLKTNGVDDFFIGHVGGDDFVITLPLDKVEAATETIIRCFDEGITRFYNNDDLLRKGIISSNRLGDCETFPIISISMAGVAIAASRYKQYIQVNDALSEGKKRAKAIEGSVFVMERRKIE